MIKWQHFQIKPHFFEMTASILRFYEILFIRTVEKTFSGSCVNLIFSKAMDYVDCNFKEVMIQLYKAASTVTALRSTPVLCLVANVSTMILEILIRLFVKSVYMYLYDM
jgi:hypothetical protein